MKIKDLVETNLDIDLLKITNDSRDCLENSIYFAMPGLEVDGHDYIDAAINNGARLIYHFNEVTNKKDNVHYEKVSDIYAVFNEVSSKFYDNPSRKLNIIAATGTNGKSTTSWIIKDMLDKKCKSGYIGTIGIKYDEELLASPFTTPLPNQYNEIFAKMVANGIKDVAIEVSSHGLEQSRVDFMHINCAIMTNLTHEHLDYHKTMENYLKAKAKLFEKLDEKGYAILNIDDDSFEYLSTHTKANVISYGENPKADLWIKKIEILNASTNFELQYDNKTYEIESNLVAEFNVYNLCAAYGALLVNGFSMEELVEYSKNITQVVGRMEKLITQNGNLVIIDYAHTPDGFEKVYDYVRSLEKKRVISVFGSAGRRDKEKRPILGAIASKYSDKIFLTEEDQVDEDPIQIAKEVQTGITIENIEIIKDRKKAIQKAFSELEDGDMLVLLGKGCDLYMHREIKEAYESDKKIVENEMKK